MRVRVRVRVRERACVRVCVCVWFQRSFRFGLTNILEAVSLTLGAGVWSVCLYSLSDIHNNCTALCSAGWRLTTVPIVMLYRNN